LLVFKFFPIGYGPTPSKRKDICVQTRSSQGFCLYNIERENPFEGRLLVCKVAKKVILFPSEWEVWKRFLQSVVSFSSVENLFLKVSSFKVKVFGREFFEFLKTSTFKFESVCCSFCVENVFFSNGVLESHGKV
jgi:hypothetical protein